MYAVGRRFNVCNFGHFSEVRPPKKPEVSSQVLKSLDTHLSSWNSRGLHDLWDHFPFVLIQLLIHLGTLATELGASDFLKILWDWSFLRSFLGQLCLNVLIHPHNYPGDLEKTREGEKNGIGLGKRVFIFGIDGFRRRSVTKRGHVQDKERGRCLTGWCQWARVSSLILGWVQL